jgi:fibro-slime domain-containing protein
MVESQLDADGKPVYVTTAKSYVASKDSFAQWYRNVAGTNHPNGSHLTLWFSGDDTYVNRWGENGERYQKTARAPFCGVVGEEKTDALGNAIPCTSTRDTDCDAIQSSIITCTRNGSIYEATYVVALLDGTPLFFPVDGDSTLAVERAPAKIPSPLYAETWAWEPGNIQHNFSFTSELRHRFVYDSIRPLTIEFVGDDDAWVFVNNRLLLDLGGLHTPVSAKATIDSTNAATYGLETGKIYEITVFHAERQTDSSSFKLLIRGAAPRTSVCTAH